MSGHRLTTADRVGMIVVAPFALALFGAILWGSWIAAAWLIARFVEQVRAFQ